MTEKQEKVLTTLYRVNPSQWWNKLNIQIVMGDKVSTGILLALIKEGYLEGEGFTNGKPRIVALTEAGRVYVKTLLKEATLKTSLLKIAFDKPETRKYLIPVLRRFT
jgi:DNA-binding PadR family transcriptional regulator